MSQSDNFQSVDSQSAISSSSTEHGVLCDCNLKAKFERVWTLKNPGVDSSVVKGVELEMGMRIKPHGWQHLALLAARDIIREQKEDLAILRNKVNTPNHEEFGEKFEEKSEECEALKREVLILGERSASFRNVLVASSVGFAIIMLAAWFMFM
ncbi:hypothetical protein Bca101_061306 [Brassica carinata]